MIIFFHDNSKITEIVSSNGDNFSVTKNSLIVPTIIEFAEKNNNEILVWCHQNEKENLNHSFIESFFFHNKFLISFNPSDSNYFERYVGYIEDTQFVNVNKKVKYATWMMSSYVGAIHAATIIAFKNSNNRKDNFDYFLNSIARLGLPKGLFCYSAPKLLIKPSQNVNLKSASLFDLYRFTKQHYRIRWVFLLFFSLLLFEKKFTFAPFLASLFYKRRTISTKNLDQITLVSKINKLEIRSIDVLIPTIGRKKYLLDVLKKLASQTHLPANVIIIEQNPIENSVSELEYIDENWPFKIKHHFTHQTGACNARNIGLQLIESEFVFMADDDIDFENTLLENAISIFEKMNFDAFLVACHLQSQVIKVESPKQFAVFGAGHAFVKSSCLKNIKFNTSYEFGFGEDNDFGMQLRNKGYDIHYISDFKILHLKAPIGGFRVKPKRLWSDDVIHSKPSPTVMLFRILHCSNEQNSSYKLTLFIKNINKSFFLNPFNYISLFKKRWNRSLYWANILKNKR
ncbi:glycosyltransferase family 2 protein [Flavobacterium dankookense]|uniref:Glycosyltransferase involved in cell wall biosynthesis n=1 Tax=Flavobacterium dankookense TaxID=706186 RepID=A0A4R6QBA5_9FLAO|nr:glycosyltransferase family A protein [Flavobacterium dankookense]TDP59226.1 glycosyltransferase involved in cell wall biosynthesis [Flavobacterium dankookense]